MTAADHALWRRHPWRLDVPLFSLAALVALWFGIGLPALRFENLFADDVFSVVDGIVAFVESGNLLLAAILFLFSVVFPAVKLVTILYLWFVPMEVGRRHAFVRSLEFLGKWSMLDSFVIAVLIGTIQLGILTEAVAESGIYVYFAAILVSLIATFQLGVLLRRDRPRSAPKPRPPSAYSLWITVSGAVLYGLGLSLPLMSVEKIFWGNRFSLLAGTGELWVRREYLLSTALAVFVIALPTVRFVGLGITKIWRAGGREPMRWMMLLDKWSMVDVFALALLVVMSKISGLAEAWPGPGMWCLLGAALLTGADSWLLYRASRT